VFTLVIGWESSRAPPAAVAETVEAIATILRPGRVYFPAPGGVATGPEDNAPEGVVPIAPAAPTAPAAEARYALRSVVCFYGRHYASFVRSGDGSGGGGAWRLFDDASVSHVGEWPAVRAACARGHLQPCVLFYERVAPAAAAPR
jgi:hypothetical protein